MSTHTHADGTFIIEQLCGEGEHVERVTRTSRLGWRWQIREGAARSPRKFLGAPRGQRGILGEEKGEPMRKVSAC